MVPAKPEALCYTSIEDKLGSVRPIYVQAAQFTSGVGSHNGASKGESVPWLDESGTRDTPAPW
jgi:hypothetical protein